MSMPRRLLLYLVCPAALVGLAVGLAVYWQRTTRPEYRLQRGRQALRRGDAPTAERMAVLLEASGHEDEAHLLRGEAWLRQESYERALKEINQIKDQGAIRLEGIALTGRCLLNLRSLREAERAFSFVLKERPDDVDAHRGLASLYYDQGALRPAVRHLEEVARLDAADGRPHRLMGLIYKDQDDYSQAIACYRAALERQLKDAAVQEVLVELAECLVRTAEFSQALDVLGRCKPAAANSPQVLTLKAECLRGMGRTSEARSLLDQALSRARAPDALRLRAQLHLEAGKAKEAAGLLEEALQLDAGDFNSRYQLVLAYEQLGRRAEAAEQRRRWQQNQEDLAQLSKLTRLAQEKPWDSDTRRLLAEVCTKLDKPDLARLWQAAASACPPAGSPRPSQP